jgi:hypothetical protein
MNTYFDFHTQIHNMLKCQVLNGKLLLSLPHWNSSLVLLAFSKLFLSLQHIMQMGVSLKFCVIRASPAALHPGSLSPHVESKMKN